MTTHKPRNKVGGKRAQKPPRLFSGARSPEPDRYGQPPGSKTDERTADVEQGSVVGIVKPSKPDRRVRPEDEQRTTGFEISGGGDIPYDHYSGPEPYGINVEAPRKKK